MAKKYFVTQFTHLVPIGGVAIGRGSVMYEMDAGEFETLSSENPNVFTVVTQASYEAEKKTVSYSGSVIQSEQIQQHPAQPAEEDKLDEAEVLKVSKVKAPEKPKKKKGKG